MKLEKFDTKILIFILHQKIRKILFSKLVKKFFDKITFKKSNGENNATFQTSGDARANQRGKPTYRKILAVRKLAFPLPSQSKAKLRGAAWVEHRATTPCDIN